MVLQPDEQVDGGIQQALLDHLRIQQSPATGTLYRAIRYDLNDDAYPDAIVQLNQCAASGCAWLLFQGSIGRTDFPRGDHDTLIRSIHEQLFPLGDDVSFIPGHGPMSTFGEERKYNPFLSGRFG